MVYDIKTNNTINKSLRSVDKKSNNSEFFYVKIQVAMYKKQKNDVQRKKGPGIAPRPQYKKIATLC